MTRSQLLVREYQAKFYEKREERRAKWYALLALGLFLLGAYVETL